MAFPGFQDVFEKYRDNTNVAFFAVNTSRDGDTIAKTRRFIEKHRYTFPVAYDAGAVVSDRFEIEHLPTVLVIDQNGKLRFRHIGYSKTFEDFDAALIEQIELALGGGK